VDKGVEVPGADGVIRTTEFEFNALPLACRGEGQGWGVLSSTSDPRIDPHPLPLPPMNKGKGIQILPLGLGGDPKRGWRLRTQTGSSEP
jgi:hypothetical protein